MLELFSFMICKKSFANFIQIVIRKINFAYRQIRFENMFVQPLKMKTIFRNQTFTHFYVVIFEIYFLKQRSVLENISWESEKKIGRDVQFFQQWLISEHFQRESSEIISFEIYFFDQRHF